MFQPQGHPFDHEKLHNVAKAAVYSLDRAIDVSRYPVPEAEVSSKRHRPIGLGVQGLADLFHMLRIRYDSLKAGDYASEIFETIYHAALEASCELAERHGPYESFYESPAANNRLQFDLWGLMPGSHSRWDWQGLRQKIKQHGLRNSLLMAITPTETSSRILGLSRGVDPYFTYVRMCYEQFRG